MKAPGELTQLFRQRGRKVTPQRQCIFRVLYDNATHPTAEAVYEAASSEMPTISLKTVYSTLNDLVQMGELELLDVGTGAGRFDPNVEASHHHLVCEACGKVRDLFLDFGSLKVPAGRRQGFVVDRAEVVFRGRCGDCTARV